MSLSSRLSSAPNDANWALSTADPKFPTITLSTGEQSYGSVRPVSSAFSPEAGTIGSRAAFRALHETYQHDTQYLRLALQRRVPARLVSGARAGYKGTLEAALHGDNIPTSVVENPIESTRAGVEPLRRYHRLRRKANWGSVRIRSMTSRSRSSRLTRNIRTMTFSIGS